MRANGYEQLLQPRRLRASFNHEWILLRPCCAEINKLLMRTNEELFIRVYSRPFVVAIFS
jgi:hypothetical protein